MTTANTTAGTRQADPAGATERRLRIGIVGGTGYTGVELLRLLQLHRNDPPLFRKNPRVMLLW